MQGLEQNRRRFRRLREVVRAWSQSVLGRRLLGNPLAPGGGLCPSTCGFLPRQERRLYLWHRRARRLGEKLRREHIPGWRDPIGDSDMLRPACVALRDALRPARSSLGASQGSRMGFGLRCGRRRDDSACVALGDALRPARSSLGASQGSRMGFGLRRGCGVETLLIKAEQWRCVGPPHDR